MNAKVWIAVAAVIGLVVGGVIGYIVAPAPTPTGVTGLQGDIKIGYLEDISGSAAFWGAEARVAAETALNEVNEMLNATGAPWRLKLLVEDTQSKPEVALEKLKALHAQGVKIFIGFGTSAEVRMCKPYADTNHILLISYGSTASDLAVDDWVIRLMPIEATSDAPAVARLAIEQGVKYLIPVWRGDAWGDAVKSSLEDIFTSLGGTVLEGIRYSPEATEFSAEAATLNDKVQDAISNYGADKVGVYLVTFEEIKSFYMELLKYNPIDWGIHWYSFDTALAEWVIDTPEIADFYNRTQIICLSKIATRISKYLELQKIMEQKLGRRATLYGINGYDMVWLVAQALMATQKYDPALIKQAILKLGEVYSGAAGNAPFNDVGDRIARNVALLRVVVEDGDYVWREVGYWDYATDSITWYPKPVPYM